MRRALLGLLLLVAACGNDPPRKWPYLLGDGGTAAVDAGAGVRLRLAGVTGVHVSACDDPTCGNATTNPPLGGNHCPSWLPCRKYDTAQARCQWLHNLEHGHAVLAYNCPGGCPELVAKLGALWDALQPNPTRKRTLLTPDPKLPRKVAAVVWGFGWMGDDYDEAAITEVL